MALERNSKGQPNKTRFSVTRDDLALLIHPIKNPDQLRKLGGCSELLKALCVDPNLGIYSVPKSKKTAVRTNIKETLSPPTQVISSGAEVSEDERRAAFGENRLPPMRANNLFDYMLAALSDKIMILLSTVSVISLALGLYEDFGPQADPTTPRIHWVEGFSILVAVVLIVFCASMNDLQKESKFRKLNDKKEDRSVKGIRNGETQLISIYDLLVGDILLMEPGDVLAADGVLISGMGLRCDESSATGESDTIKKSPDHDPILLSGSQVTEGMGKYVITSVGVDSFFGKIMMSMRTESEDTPLQVKLDNLAERIAKFGAAGAVFMFIILLLKYVIGVLKTNGFGNSPNQENGTEVASQILKIIMQSVAVIAIAVPEGLPLAVTLALAYATTRMMKDNNLVRVISACETMGNATTICSDKTGTLTQNRMTVVAGVIGKNVTFEGDKEIEGLPARISSLPKDNVQDANLPSMNSKAKQPGLSGEDLLARIMEGVCINTSIFETKDKAGQTTIVGSKTETALVEWANRCGFPYKKVQQSPEISVVQMFPFSSERKTMATLIKISRPNYPAVYRIHVKGASEIVLKSCDRISLLPFSASKVATSHTVEMEDQGALKKSNSEHSLGRPPDAIPAVGSRSNPMSPIVYPLDSKLRKDCAEKIESYAHSSLRTICLAYRDFSEQEFQALMNGAVRNRVTAVRKEEAEAKEQRTKERKSEPEILVSTEKGLKVCDSPKLDDILETKSFESARGSTPKPAEEEMSDADLLSYSAAFTDVLGLNLICAAIVGIEDPLRAGVEEAVRTCQNAGVVVRMVTGDNVTTALSIAKKCGIYQKGGIVMEGARFRQLTESERELVLPRLQVLARSSPTDKQLLVASLKLMGDIVAVTGDGTNDGPALKLADVGFSMGIAGTEVAKEASSIILMDDSFSSVVKAIIWGRCVNDSVKKFLQFQLSVNVSAMLITLISSIMDSSESSVLTVVQLLWVNLVIDTLAALALGTEKPMPDVLDRPPELRTAPLINLTMWKMIFGQAVLQVAVNLALLFGGAQFFGFDDLIAEGGILGINQAVASSNALNERSLLRTIVFNTFVLMQVFNQANCRRINSNINIFTGIFENPFFGSVFTFVVVVQALIIEYGGVTFQTTPLNGPQWAFCILVGFTSIPWGLIIRLIPNDIFPEMNKNQINTGGNQATQNDRPSVVALNRGEENKENANNEAVISSTGIHSGNAVQSSSAPKLKSLDSLKFEPFNEELRSKTGSNSNPNLASAEEEAQAVIKRAGTLRKLAIMALQDEGRQGILSMESQTGSMDGGFRSSSSSGAQQTQVYSLLRGQSRRRSSAATTGGSIKIIAPPMPQRSNTGMKTLPD